MKFDVERTSTDATPVHWAEHLNIAHWIDAEPAGDTFFYDFHQSRYGCIRRVGRNEVKICFMIGFGEIRKLSGIDAMFTLDDLTSSPSSFGEGRA
ncbi:hypothetical protein [Ochrobactrum quorumnocens]|uniref:hypothetical protein n=1 Tax=Ochrobactrum quorumnocens TaxID=271865 RepID=UPI001FD5537F|nr:hypothetical protein [[Ochrobactrum] quorumnocens]